MLNPLSMMRIMRDFVPYTRVHFLYTAIESGLLETLMEPTSREELIQKLNVKRPDILEPLLDLGVSLGELSCRGGQYAVKGKRSRALMGEEGDMLTAVIQEAVTYYSRVHRDTTSRLQGAPSGDYLGAIGDMVARFSKLTEPFVRNFVRPIIAGKDPMRILDIGCGSGVHLRSALELNSNASGLGIDMDENVIAQATRNLEAWGINDRFRVVFGDITDPPPEVAGPFDMITLYNIIYYFPVDERAGLYRSLRSMLSPGGAIVMVSSAQGKGKDIWAANLDLATRSTLGCAPLPDQDEVIAELKECGFNRIKQSRIMPGSAYYGTMAAR